jgi:formylglycine-generating enzyme required for sulfatase activity
LSANKFSLRDMIGNVAEWTLDCNTLNLRDAPVDGSADARGSCGQRVVRGGSWFSGPDDLRYSARTMLRRGDRNDFTGFRVIRTLGG